MPYVERKFKKAYCKLCQRAYTPNSSRQLCCHDCKTVYNNAKNRAKGKPEDEWLPELRKKQKEKLTREGKMKKPGEMDLNEMAAAAAAHGMSYGKYMERLAYEAAMEGKGRK